MSEITKPIMLDETGKEIIEALKGISRHAATADMAYDSEKLGGKEPIEYLGTGDVPEWAKQPNKPTYTASEVGALPSDGKAVDSDKLNGHPASDFATTATVTALADDVSFSKAELKTINSNLTSEISRAKETEEVLKSRIDTITSLQEGSTTGDAELQDIRVKADGTIAENAGNAVREQFSELKGDLSEVKSLFDVKVYKDITSEVVTKNGFYRWSDGKYFDYEIAQTTDLLPCKYGDKYLVSSSYGDDVAVCVLFDANKQYLGYKFRNEESGMLIVMNQEITVDVQEACYITFSTYVSDKCPLVVKKYVLKSIDEALKPNKGLRWAVFGDSLTEYNARAEKHYFDYVADDLGLSIVNYGKSGTGYKKREDESIAFYQRMENVNADDYDFMTIFGSFNDMSLLPPNTVLGTYSDTTTDTIGGCMNLAIDKFYEKTPFKKLGIITPTPWHGSDWGNGNAKGTWGEKYCQLLVDICNNRGIPCLDLFHCSGMKPWNEDFRTEYYTENGITDNGVHPSSKGHKFFYPMVREFVKTLI